MADLDSVMDILDSMDERDRRMSAPDAPSDAPPAPSVTGKVQVGSVECFFNKIGVVAIKLEGTLRVGDIIEIGDEEEAVRQRVASMQIDRCDVDEAYAGDSVGIKFNYKVPEGRIVYRIG